MCVIKKIIVALEIELITKNSIIYVIGAWIITIILAKLFKLNNYGFDIKLYSITYKNYTVQNIFTRILRRTKFLVSSFANVSILSGFIMMFFAFWFLSNNITSFFIKPTEFAEMTLLIPGVTLTSTSSIMYFLLSIPIVLVMHEGAHGIVATLEKIKIKSGGFAVFIAMFAGFVEPDEKEFSNAKRISKLKVISAGATSNVLFSLLLSCILITNPLFAIILPEPFLSFFYEIPEGVKIISVMKDSDAEISGLQSNDIIISINNINIKSPIDFKKIELNPYEVVEVVVSRNNQELKFMVTTIENPNELGNGLIGIIRDNSLSYKPLYNFLEWKNQDVSMFLIWLWMISFFIGIINMLPLPILDGGKFIQCIIEKKTSEKTNNIIMWIIYSGTLILFVTNISLSYIKSGWFTI